MTPIKSLIPWLWAWAIAVASLVLLVDEVLNQEASIVLGLSGVFLTVLFTFLGTLIAIRQPGNRIAWLLLVIGFGILLTGVLPRFTGAEPESPSFLDYSALVLDNWVGLNLIFYPLVLITYLFPTGHFFRRRQAWVGWLGAVMVPASLLVALFAAEIGPAFQQPDEAWAIVNPIGFLPAVALDVVLSVWGLGLVLLAFGGIWSLITRYRKSSVVVKTQIRWMLLASLILAIGFLLIVVTDTDSNISGVFVALAFASIPVSITIAITRYRLFEIDRIINRTVVYAIVVVALAGFYALVVSASAALLPTADNDLAIVASVLIAAAVFNPLRRRVQSFVDRRFYRSRFDAELIAQSFTERMRDEVDPQAITDSWIDVVTETMQPESVGVWIRNQT